MENNYKNIDEYIELFPKDIQKKLIDLRKVIRDNAKDAIEIISWRMPTFKLKENLIHFAVFKHHIGIYPGPEAIVQFKDELSNYKTSKGAIQFPLDKPIPFDLVKKIVEYRVNSIEGVENGREKDS